MDAKVSGRNGASHEGVSADRADAALLQQVNHEHVLEAIKRVEAGAGSVFAESTKYDLLCFGKRYPPKRIAGVALEVATGERFGPYAFKGGLESSCFRALQVAGFTIVPKHEEKPSRSLAEDLLAVLSLQLDYDSSNTPSMQRRGEIIRKAIPTQLRLNSHLFEPLFTKRGYAFAVEGSDGVGRKSESAWVRIFDPQMAPSATSGWYVVIHFSRTGDNVYATLGCGSTSFLRGSFIPIGAEELSEKVAWAKSLSETEGFAAKEFDESIKLGGNELSDQFELATAYAKAFDREALKDANFLQALQSLAFRLLDIYDAQRLGRDPVDRNTVVDQAAAEVLRLISPRKSTRGQGRGLSGVERIAVEKQAMKVVADNLLELGFVSVKDVSATKSYDFEGVKDGKTWLIEVKGTTGTGSDQFLLTAAELKLHRSERGSTALAFVTDIHLHRLESHTTASGGEFTIEMPWDPDGWDFEPTSFRAQRLKTA